MTNRIACLAAALLLLLLAGVARAGPESLDLAQALDRLREHEDHAVMEAAREASAGGSLSAVGARAHMEALAIYREVRRQAVPVDWTKVGMPADPDPSVFSAVGRVRPSSSWTLDAVDQAIAKDQGFLAQRGNNSVNETYVRARLAALKTLRELVGQGLVEHANGLAEKGDDAMAAQLAHDSLADLETRARLAEQALGAAANSRTMTLFTQALGRLREAMQRTTRMAGNAELRASLSALKPATDAAGDYEVVVMHIQSETFGGIGNLEPGKDTTLLVGDNYHVVMDTRQRIDERKARWQKQYEYDWCRYENIVPYIARSRLTFLLDLSGLSKAEASAISSKATQALRDAGYAYGNRGYVGPADGSHVPFTVPGNAKEIGPCK